MRTPPPEVAYIVAPHLPVYITENDVADSGDVRRVTFVTDPLEVLARARGEVST